MAIVKTVGRGATKTTHALMDLDTWRAFAGPKDVLKQWQNNFSAKEAARRWLGALPSMPDEVVALLITHQAFGEITAWSAEPEVQLRFDEYGGPRNTDLLVQAADAHGQFHLAVEAKVRESFGETVARALATALIRREKLPTSNAVARIAALCREYFGAEPTDHDVSALRYQLLTATAGAVNEALRAGVGRTVLLVHEFVKEPASHRTYAANAKALEDFVRRLTFGRVEEVLPKRLVEVPLPPSVLRGRSLRFYVGKASHPLPRASEEAGGADSVRE